MAMRNPIITIGTNWVQTIGDTHLGRVFKTNVSLERRGEYEKLQLQTFRELLFTKKPDGVADFIRVQVGDLFDKAVVSNQVVFETITLLQEYEAKSSTPLYIISGNHDDSKSTTEVTSWDIVAEFFKNSTYVRFIKSWYPHAFSDGEELLLVGWNIHQNVAQAFIEAENDGFTNVRSVFCHLDRISYGNDDNVIPYDFLKAKNVDLVVTGHEHKPFDFTEGNLHVIGTGSLLPYSHAEDPDGDHYVTFKGYAELVVVDIEDLKHKHVRVYIAEEDMETFLSMELDCISLQVNKLENLDIDEGVTEVQTESYNAKEIWERSVAETSLPSDEGQLIWAEIEMKGIENE